MQAAGLIILVIGLPWLGALGIWLARDERPKLQRQLAVSATLAGGVASLALLTVTSSGEAIRIPLNAVFGAITFVPDGLGCFLAAVASVVGCLTVIFSVDYMREEHQLGRYYVLVLVFIGAMSGLVLTGSLLILLVFWEIVAFCSYALISFDSDNPKAVAGGIKALVITQIGGLGLLVGVLVGYAYLGSYDINALLSGANSLPPEILGVIAFAFLIAAAAKSAQVPFHTWLPGAMEAPTPVSALIHAATMVNAGVYLLARFYPAFENVPGWKTVVVIVGLLSALLAGFMALTATDLKRVLAYSTISQLGYLFYAVGVGAIFASQFHLLSHAVFKALLFLSAGAVTHAVGTRDLRKMGGLGEKLPLVRNVMIIGALALAGVPILNGFWSKELILEGGSEGGPDWAYLGMMLGVLLTALYSLRLILLVFYGKPRGEAAHIHTTPQSMRLALIVLAIGTCLTWLLVDPFSSLLKGTLPFHLLEVEPLGSVITQIVSATTTYAALGLMFVGVLLWVERNEWFAALVQWLQRLGDFAAHDFGFESINQWVVSGTRRVAATMQHTQTGQLNWNIAGLVIGLIAVLIVVVGITAGGVR